MSAKKRLDALLVERGLVASLPEATGMVMAGVVYSGTKRLDKAGSLVADDIPIQIKQKKGHAWVSRGGIKLDHALAHFAIDVKNVVAVDVGSSTGGFTDVLLTGGAAHVYAVDVGYGELAWKLRNDPKVTVLERTNARHLSAEQIPTPPALVVCDASFIGLKTVLPAVLNLAAPGAILVALIKPQFEVAKEEVGPKGVVSDPVLHERVCKDIAEWINGLGQWTVRGITPSPIKGPEGNVEFLIVADKSV